MKKKCFVSRLTKRIQLEMPSNIPNDCGGMDTEWREGPMLWAEIRPVAPASVFEAGRTEDSISHLITIRHNPEIKVGQRLRYDGRIFNILGLIDEMEEGRVMLLKCEEML